MHCPVWAPLPLSRAPQSKFGTPCALPTRCVSADGQLTALGPPLPGAAGLRLVYPTIEQVPPHAPQPTAACWAFAVGPERRSQMFESVGSGFC